MSPTLHTCCHCGKTNAEVAQMIQLANQSLLCGECITVIGEFAQAGRTDTALAAEPGTTGADGTTEKGRTPRELVAFLDQYIVGQSDAKMTLAIAVHNHYKRLNAGVQGIDIDKSNILLLGPTGTGKTLLAKTIARCLDVPFTVADATSLTQAGYVGDDVETVLQRLIQAADGDIAKAERGIVFIDEIDKLAAAKSGASITRDVSGEGVQQALLKIIEGARVSVPVSGNRKAPNGQVDYIETKDILFICAGAFVSLLEKLQAPADGGRVMGFIGAAANEDQAPREVTPELLSEFGMIPEFVGRLPIIQTLEPLDVDALERILTEPKNAVVRQMEELLAMDGACLAFEPGAVRAIAERAHQLKTGARGARSILEKLLKQAQFDVPGTQGAVVTVTAKLTVRIDWQQVKLAA
jgi:ATP-dependent Clp protease ATP-binding subunit ClpX